jgi:class 3 adenylate cyclase
MRPSTGYARIGDQSVAYQVIGEGPVDVVTVLGARAPFDAEWDDPSVRAWYRQFDGFARNIRFDTRGVGASDPLPPDPLPSWESLADEVEAVLDALRSDRAVILAGGNGGPAGALFATTRPERTAGIIFFQSSARWLVDDDYPFGLTEDELDALLDRIGREWGTDALVGFFFPSRVDDPEFHDYLAKHERATTSPAAIQKLMAAEMRADARPLLEAIRVPTLVIHRTDSPAYPIEHGRYIAAHVDGAELVELPGGDAAPYWEKPELSTEAIKNFLSRTLAIRQPDRQLATIVFTDIVDSTTKAEELGDRRWQALLDRHNEIASQIVADHEGRLIRSTGDGIIATFSGPGRAIAGSAALQRQMVPLDLTLRVGVHTGEIETSGDDIGGIAVHLAARIVAEARPGEILVSRTVKDLVVGSDLVFADRGTHELKGIEDSWQLYSVAAA